MTHCQLLPKGAKVGITKRITISWGSLMLNVLLVDDNAEKRFLYSRILRYLGCNVTEFPDAPIAQKLLNYRNPFDVIITDLYMPKMNGVEFFEWLKTNYPRTPVVIISASASPPPETVAKTKGAACCLFGYTNKNRLKMALEHATQAKLQ
jgi:CheY-like chemotaxis protein